LTNPVSEWILKAAQFEPLVQVANRAETLQAKIEGCKFSLQGIIPPKTLSCLPRLAVFCRTLR